MTRVMVTIDASAVARVIGRDVEAAVARAAERTRERVAQNIVNAGRVDTGRMRDTLYVQRLTAGQVAFTYEVGSDLHYTLYQEEGVAGPITPKRAKVLRFRPKGSGVYIFRAWTSGFAGAHMFRKALAALKVRDFLP